MQRRAQAESLTLQSKNVSQCQNSLKEKKIWDTAVRASVEEAVEDTVAVVEEEMVAEVVAGVVAEATPEEEVAAATPKVEVAVATLEAVVATVIDDY